MVIWGIGPGLSLSLPRVISVKFLGQPHQKHITQSMENVAFHRLLRWKMIILPILTTSLIHFSLKSWENLLFWTWEWKGYTAPTRNIYLNDHRHLSLYNYTVQFPIFTLAISYTIFQAILRTKPAPAFPTRVLLTCNTAIKPNQVGIDWIKECPQLICDNFVSNPRDASRKSIRAG